ncbi:MAG: hypothetical protein INF91_06510 [Alphaproteobacteria bacterium]|nr:hypothetical protein [Alphaproteobacteria bacterium]
MLAAARRGKYRKLHEYLGKLTLSEWTTSFAVVESILGFRLPDSARLYRPWWANGKAAGHSQSMAWMTAGWMTSGVDLDAERVTFVRK